MFKTEFGPKLSGDSEAKWTKMMKFGRLKMKEDEDVEIYSKNYETLETMLCRCIQQFGSVFDHPAAPIAQRQRKNVEQSVQGNTVGVEWPVDGNEADEEDSCVEDQPSLSEQKEIDWFLERRIGAFDGEDWSNWENFILMFEKVVVKRKWDRYNQETLMDMITGRLKGDAKDLYTEWILEDPKVSGEYVKFKTSFPGRSKENNNSWKLVVDFIHVQMGKEESVDQYAKRYATLAKQIDPEKLAAGKYFFS